MTVKRIKRHDAEPDNMELEVWLDDSLEGVSVRGRLHGGLSYTILQITPEGIQVFSNLHPAWDPFVDNMGFPKIKFINPLTDELVKDMSGEDLSN